MSGTAPRTDGVGIFGRLFGRVGRVAPAGEDQDGRGDGAVLVRLDAIERALADLADRADANPPPAPPPAADEGGLAELRGAVAALDKQIGRAGREQFKANALAETGLERLDEALASLRDAEARQEAEVAALREGARAAQVAARLEVVRAVLPALDGLDEALRSGRQLLDRPASPPPPTGFLARLVGQDHSRETETALREGMAAWLTGLTFVRRQLLDALAAEGVRPMDAAGQPFDPRRHVALEVVPPGDGLATGTVVAELRRGYLLDDRPLRYAEVAVAGEPVGRAAGQ